MSLQIPGSISGVNPEAVIEQLMSLGQWSRNREGGQQDEYLCQEAIVHSVKTDLPSFPTATADWSHILDYPPISCLSTDDTGKGGEPSVPESDRDIQKAQEGLEKLEDIRPEKVKELKTQIEAGTYNIAGEDIAEKMIKRIIDPTA
jgi:flagellar biosynthesis anti-sigma factor FlgM